VNNEKVKPHYKVDYWLKSSNKNRFNNVVFEPVPGLLARDYEPFPLGASKINTYKGLVVTPFKGDVKLLQDYVLNVIANGDVELADYITKWVAIMVQKPNQPGQTVLVIKSIEGTGKTLFFSQTIGSFFGRAFFETASGEQVFGKFNNAAAEAVFINLNEAVWGGDKTAEGRMKQLATDQHITVEKKFHDAQQAINFAHVVITSNNSWAVGVGDSNRRYVVFEMAKKMPKDYYDKYAKWLNSGGREAALHYFLNEVDISDFDPRNIPKAADANSRLMLDQKLLSTDNMTKFMLHILSQPRFSIGKLEFDSELDDAGVDVVDEQWSVGWVPIKNGQDAILTIEKHSLYEVFERFSRKQKSGASPSMNSLGRFLNGNIPGEGDEVFATECQKFKSIYPSGKRWRFSWQGVVNALNAKLNTNRIGDFVDIGDVIGDESGLTPYLDDEVDFLG